MQNFDNGAERPAKSYHGLMKAAVVLIALCGAAICVFWFPYGVSSGMPALAETGGREYWTAFASECVFFYLAALPCFVIAGYLWKVSDLVREGRLFSAAGVRCFHRSAVILFFDLIFFLFGNIVFARMGLNGWFWLYIFLTLCGAAVALLFFVVAKCLGEAAKLQEESDGTI